MMGGLAHNIPVSGQREPLDVTEHAVRGQLSSNVPTVSQMAARDSQTNPGLFVPGSRQYEPAPTLNNVDPAVRKSILEAAKSYASQQSRLKEQALNNGRLQKNGNVPGYGSVQNADDRPGPDLGHPQVRRKPFISFINISKNGTHPCSHNSSWPNYDFLCFNYRYITSKYLKIYVSVW